MVMGNVAVSSLDAALLTAWLLISILWNKSALIMTIELSVYLAIQAVTETDFQAHIICSTLYFWICTTNIKLSKEFLRAFFAFGVVYSFSAIDHFIYSHLQHDTQFDRIQPYLITVINTYVLAHLLDGGRRDNVLGFANYCAKRIRWVKLHILSGNKNKVNTQ